MQALTLPSRRGWGWLADGFRIYRKNPFMLGVLVVGYWMLIMMVHIVPVLGRVVATLCIPAFAVSLMNICRAIEQGESPTPNLLFSGFKENLRELLILGAIYILASLAILGLVSIIDDGALFWTILVGKGAGGDEISRDDFMLAAQASLVLFIPVTLAYWYSPALAAWHSMSAGKALFFSLVACWRNWRAFLVYALALILLGLFLPGMVLAVLGRLISADDGSFTSLFAVYAVMILAPVVYASFYVSYRDVFVSVDEAA